MEKQVAIVGAGITGLLACKYVVARGFKPIVFEEKDQIGGVWNQTIESTRLQNVKEVYKFSDFPWPSSVEEDFPHNTQVLEYIQSYAQHFELLPYIKFNSKVVNVDYVGESDEEMQSWELWGGTGKAFGSAGKWTIIVQDTKDGSIKEYVSEFLILCIGRFSGLADIPEFPKGYGPEVFPGKALHAMEYSALDNASALALIKGKRVAVIGAAKSAVDIAYECAEANGRENPCTLVLRTAHWMLPVHPWGQILPYIWPNRFAELAVHKPGEGFLHSILATLLSPMRWGISKLTESYIKWTLPLKKYNMIPNDSFVQQMNTCQVGWLHDNFYNKVEEESISLRKSQSFTFCKEGLMLEGNPDPVKANVVIFATGYQGDQKLKNIFASPKFQKCIIGSPTSTIPLYREMIHPRIPQLAVLGYSESLCNLYTSELRAQWLAFLLDKTFQLPSIREMEKDVSQWEKYMKQYGGEQYRRASVAGVHVWYSDLLCKDIGCNPRRKKGFFSELFEPYGVEDHKRLAPECSYV